MFPSHQGQLRIAAGFSEMSAAKFKTCAGPLDGMLIWTTVQDCLDIGVGERSCWCQRKGKFGMLFIALCDHECTFRWVDIIIQGVPLI